MALYGKSRAQQELTSGARPDPCPPVSDIPPRSINKLRRRLRGRVVVRGEDDYPQASRNNPRYPACPQAVVYCKSPADVRLALQLAKQLSLDVTCRSGGHSTAGYSANDGLVL